MLFLSILSVLGWEHTSAVGRMTASYFFTSIFWSARGLSSQKVAFPGALCSAQREGLRQMLALFGVMVLASHFV